MNPLATQTQSNNMKLSCAQLKDKDIMSEKHGASSWINTFNMLDTDQSGFIDISELKAGLVALGQPSSDDDIARFLEAEGISKCRNGDVSIDLDTFLCIATRNDSRELSQSDLFDMFSAIDIDASGYLTAAELQHFLGNLPNPCYLGDSKMSQLLGMYDVDGNGRITFDEFEALMADLGFNITGDSPCTVDKAHQSKRKKANNDAAEEKVPDLDDANNSINQSRSKSISLTSVNDKDLRETLALLDTTGNGTIDLSQLREAIEGRTSPKLHWSEKRPRSGLANYIRSLNHIAILVSDVSLSLAFYKNVMGFEQIRRPNFDAHGAWLTMGNVELHLIKGKPVVHEGDDLVVGHISIDTDNIQAVHHKLESMNVPFRRNSSVPAGADTGSINTNSNDNMMSNKIVHQFFLRDPDGYYIEICNCDETLTKYSLGEKDELPGYEESIRPISFRTATMTMNLMQRWIEKLEIETSNMEDVFEKVNDTDGTIQQVADLLGCKHTTGIDESILQTLKDRHSIYGDIWQNEEESDIEDILRAAGNDPKISEKIVKLRHSFRGKTIYRPPVVFNSDGTKYAPAKIEMLH